MTDTNTPQAADVVIIGGGIIGTATALFLARRGVSVALCEKGAVAGEASGRSLGQVGSAGLAAVKMELLQEAKGLWTGMNALAGGETGYRRTGYIAPFSDEPSQHAWEKWMTTTGALDAGARLLSGSEAGKLAPSTRQWRGAYYNATDGCAEPTLAAPAFAEAAQRLGVKVIAPCAVRGVETEGGRVCGVVTESGRIRSSSVVLAGGCWSRLFCANTGLFLPLLNVHAYCESVYGVEAGPPGAGDAPGVSWRKQIDGGYAICVIGGHAPIVPAMLRLGPSYLALLRSVHWELELSFGKTFFQELGVPARWSLEEISPFERNRILEPRISDKFAILARSRIVEYLPAFKGMKPGAPWSGVLCTPPDNTPTMSPVRSVPGLYLATGFSYGLTMAPAAGKLMADLVTGTRPSIDPTPYRYERYVDGTVLEPLD